jgi:hypothetical protein
VLDHLKPGEVLLGDALFATYFLLAELKRRGVDGVFEQYGARRCSTDFRRGRRLGARDHVIELKKPVARPSWMTPEQYARVPDTLTVRELLAGGKLLVTTLLCSRQTPKDELKALYQQRWHAELDLRCIKNVILPLLLGHPDKRFNIAIRGERDEQEEGGKRRQSVSGSARSSSSRRCCGRSRTGYRRWPEIWAWSRRSCMRGVRKRSSKARMRRLSGCSSQRRPG